MSRSKIGHLITAADRVKEFGSDVFETNSNKLFCRYCCKIVGHDRRQTITDHLQSKQHKEKCERPQKKQRLLETAFQATAASAKAKEDITLAYLKTLVATNTPIEKTDHPQVRQSYILYKSSCRFRSKEKIINVSSYARVILKFCTVYLLHCILIFC